jgi:hypothetical protein
MIKENCEFCNQTQDRFQHFSEYGVDRIDLTRLWQTDKLFVKPDVLPVSGGFHGLVIPFEHRFSFAQNHGLNEEVGQLLSTIKEKIGKDLVWFEHGGIQEGSKVQSVYHNHAHIIATEEVRVLDFMEDVLDEMNIHTSRLVGVDASPAFNVHALGLEDKGYIYIQQKSEALLAINDDDSFPSQIAQRNMSRLLSGRELNWKQLDTDPELAKLSIVRILDIINLCKK